jgi:hypothetical protein
MAESATGPVKIDLQARRYGGSPRATYKHLLGVVADVTADFSDSNLVRE